MTALNDYFQSPQHHAQKQYEAVRAFIVEHQSAEQVAKQFGYTPATIYWLVKDFKQKLAKQELDHYLFSTLKPGRNKKQNAESLQEKIVALRKQYLSVEEIKAHLDTQNDRISETYIYQTIKATGFARLPRRSKLAKQDIQSTITIDAPKTEILTEEKESFNTSNIGLLCFLPIIQAYELDALIENSSYPETKTLPRLHSILSFVALKLSNIKRYTKDDLWCMDRGLGLFAGLNVLPKAAWFSSYSHRVTREMNMDFLRALHQLWVKQGLLSDTVNLDFTTLPCWGDDAHLEKNWSGTRHKALSSILAAIAQDPESGLLTHGDANVQQSTESETVIEFLDFYKANGDDNLKYLVFDSKFTSYENLKKLDERNIKFVTIRRRGQKIVSELEQLPSSAWQKVRVMAGDGKKRLLKVCDQKIILRNYGQKEIRQLAIMGHGRIKPALIITNDFTLTKADIIRKYAQRWIVEKSIAEQTHFFHLNRLSSSMVIKVDFDLTMTIFAYNLYRLLAQMLSRYSHQTAEKLYDKFISNAGQVKIDDDTINVLMKKKRHLPAMLSAMKQLVPCKISWIADKKINISAATHS